MIRPVKLGQARRESAKKRLVLRELVLTTLAQSDGRARESAVLRVVRDTAQTMVPSAWRKPHPPYRSRLEFYADLERATLGVEGLIDTSERGYWKLTHDGWRQARKLLSKWKTRGAARRILPQVLAFSGEVNWLGRIAGSLRDEPDFDEVLRLGRTARAAHHDRKQ